MTQHETARHVRQRLAGAALSGVLVLAGVALLPSPARAASVCNGYDQPGVSVSLTWMEKGLTPGDTSTTGNLTVCDDAQIAASRNGNTIVTDPTNGYGSLVQRGSADMRIGEMKAYANNAFAWDRGTYVTMADLVTFDVADFARNDLGYAKVTLTGTLDGVFNSRSTQSSVGGTFWISAYSLTGGAEPVADFVSLGLYEELGWDVYQEGAFSFDIWVRDGEQWFIDSYFSVAAINMTEWTGGYASADLLHTATLAMDVAQGVTWTSQTGQFLADRMPGAGPVPEPATWAMLLLGFGLVGGLARSRAGRVQFA